MPTLDDYDWNSLSHRTCCLRFEDLGLTGTIPTEIGLLTNLQTGLVFSRNSLTGTIPTEIGMLTKMRNQLKFDHNFLTGALP
jgi:hypothetical protein